MLIWDHKTNVVGASLASDPCMVMHGQVLLKVSTFVPIPGTQNQGIHVIPKDLVPKCRAAELCIHCNISCPSILAGSTLVWCNGCMILGAPRGCIQQIINGGTICGKQGVSMRVALDHLFHDQSMFSGVQLVVLHHWVIGRDSIILPDNPS